MISISLDLIPSLNFSSLYSKFLRGNPTRVEKAFTYFIHKIKFMCFSAGASFGAGLFFPETANGLKDPFGPFTVTVDANKMQWQREENGNQVTVSLVRITEMPKATADKLQGLWGLHKVIKNGETITDSTDPDNQQYIFIRWDRIYMARNPDGQRKTGYWHINGHRPELTLLPHNEADEATCWKVSVNGETLKMTGINTGNKGIARTYKRLDEFPL